MTFLNGRVQMPRPEIMPDRREGNARTDGSVFAHIECQSASKEFIA